jgi:hypothetical protein
LQGQHYKLYGVEGSTLKKNQLQLTNNDQETQSNIQQQKQEKDLTNMQGMNEVKPLKTDKLHSTTGNMLN